MSNANLIPVKKRKQPASTAQNADWLFPKAENSTSESTTSAVTKKEKKKDQIQGDAPVEEKGKQEQFKKQYSEILGKEIYIGAHHAKKNPVPPVALLNLIGRYFAEIGFVGTGRVLSTERQGRSTIDCWEDDPKMKFDKRWPSLGKIFKDWEKKWEAENATSSSSEEDSSSSEGESDVEMEDAPAVKKPTKKSPTV